MDRAQKYGEGEEGFGMKSLAGDKGMIDQGIMKTTDVYVDRTKGDSIKGGSRSDLESGERFGDGQETFIYLWSHTLWTTKPCES